MIKKFKPMTEEEKKEMELNEQKAEDEERARILAIVIPMPIESARKLVKSLKKPK